MVTRLLLLASVTVAILLPGCGSGPDSDRQEAPAASKPTQQSLSTEQQALTSKPERLPPHQIAPSSRPGKTKAQIRAIVPLGELTENEFKQVAVRLANENETTGGSYLVEFFDDKSCLQEWDRTGLLRDLDWPHWLCRVTVETDMRGELYTRTFKLAVDESTGMERTDVLRQ